MQKITRSNRYLHVEPPREPTMTTAFDPIDPPVLPPAARSTPITPASPHERRMTA